MIKRTEALEEVAKASRHLLDLAERDRAGFPLTAEHWYAVRDGMRAALEDLDALACDHLLLPGNGTCVRCGLSTEEKGQP